MTGLLAFQDRYADEQACIAALASVRWPDGFVCAACGGRRNYQLRARPRVFECAGCGRIAELADFVLRRAVDCRTITYRQLVDGIQPQGATPASSG